MTTRAGSGLFIALEGVEGSGKSTQSRLLGEWLASSGIAYTLGREPGGTALGEEIRRVLLHGGDDVPARAELFLMLAARAAFVDGVVRPALDRGEVVVSDRYELSSFAYQGYGRGLSLAELRQANTFATGGLTADLTIVLDVAVEAGAARQGRSGGSGDRIERAGPTFHERVARAYRLLSEAERDVVMVDGSLEPAVVQDAIRRLLAGRFPETFPSAQG